MASIFHEYAEDATIHGLKDISKNWSRTALRTFCMLCQVVSMAAMCYHMGLIIAGYTNQPTSIQTTTVTSKTYEYPAVTFCPEHWLNVTKFEELGMPGPALLYALSLLRRIKIDEPVENVSEAENLLNRFMQEKKFASYFDLYLTLANDFDNSSLYCEECSDWPPRKVVTEQGVCYFINFKDYIANVLAIREPRLTYNPVSYNQTGNISILNAFSTKDITETLYIGTHINDFFSLEPIYLLLNTTYILRITPMRHIFIDDASTPCLRKVSSQSKLMCEAYCHEQSMDQFCAIPHMLGLFNGSHKARPLSPNDPGPRLWSSLVEDPQKYHDAVRSCEERFQGVCAKCDEITCPQPCQKMTYSTTVSAINTRRVFQDLNESALTLVISYQVRTGIIEAQEVMTYTWYSFLSNVGGVMGLWCGASLISMYQLTLFFGKTFIYLCYQWKADSHMEDSGAKAGGFAGPIPNVISTVSPVPVVQHR